MLEAVPVLDGEDVGSEALPPNSPSHSPNSPSLFCIVQLARRHRKLFARVLGTVKLPPVEAPKKVAKTATRKAKAAKKK